MMSVRLPLVWAGLVQEKSARVTPFDENLLGQLGKQAK